jgi:hypothetical protein
MSSTANCSYKSPTARSFVAACARISSSYSFELSIAFSKIEGFDVTPRRPTVLEFISFGAHIGSEYGGHRHASNRANPGRQDVLLSSLRSTLFGDVFAAFQEWQQYRKKMCGLPAKSVSPAIAFDTSKLGQ